MTCKYTCTNDNEYKPMEEHYTHCYAAPNFWAQRKERRRGEEEEEEEEKKEQKQKEEKVEEEEEEEEKEEEEGDEEERKKRKRKKRKKGGCRGRGEGVAVASELIASQLSFVVMT